MVKLFLASSFGDSYQYLKDFSPESLTGKTVTFINTASKVEEMTNYIDSAKQAFKQLGMTAIELDISQETKEDIRKVLQSNDVIYVAGGNTFYLLQEIKKKAVDKMIIHEIIHGKIYIGESAGAIIMSPDITYISYLDDQEKAVELKEYSGLNQIDFYPLPHLENHYLNEAISQIITTYENKINLIPFKDNQVILYKEGKMQLI